MKTCTQHGYCKSGGSVLRRNICGKSKFSSPINPDRYWDGENRHLRQVRNRYKSFYGTL
ncbi:MAG: hypothetical protein KA251_02290 [Saprospiraceae bacterium]|nr:hypothetical protein [Candidatus Vicinibacter affinis]MBP6173770.1 hypothetical protein [Saprospiraceae bacterium]MBK7302357.1 hypothetical protein [Candidatus Vicinibacter affinis]MBK7693481.1 hypothetical protein [Candidatus Vicinibacter affinis]MBK7798316.1 hypothetical protein [Candidatus Vicinibacter affinis]